VTNAHALGIAKTLTIQGDSGSVEQVAASLEIWAGSTGVVIRNLALADVSLDTGSSQTQIVNSQLSRITETGTGTLNGSNLISGNTFLGPAILTGNDAGTPTRDQVLNNEFDGPGAAISIIHDDGAIIQGNHMTGDAPNFEAAITVNGSRNVSLINNEIMLSGEFIQGIRVQDSGTIASTVSLNNNAVDTGGLGVGLDVVLGNPTSGLSAQGNDLRRNLIGAFLSGNGTTIGTIDLGGGVLASRGGNDFKAFTSQATTDGSFAVYLAGAPNATISADSNIWGPADPTTLIKDGTRDTAVGGGPNGSGTIDLGARQLSANEQYVQTLYNEFLGRTGTIAELDGWSSYASTAGYAAVASGILRAPESLRRIVDNFYLKFLHRAADPAGEAGWVSSLQNGTTVEQVMAGFLSSPEYFNHSYALNRLTTPDAAFIQSLYVQLLGRPGTAQEVDSWSNILPTSGRVGVINGILSSTEYCNDEVSYDFSQLLRRTTPPAQGDVVAFANSGLDALSLEILFAGTNEFVANG
jgi:hypothetical protein